MASLSWSIAALREGGKAWLYVGGDVVLLASFLSGENDRGGVLAPEFLRPRRDILLKIDLPGIRYRIV